MDANKSPKPVIVLEFKSDDDGGKQIIVFDNFPDAKHFARENFDFGRMPDDYDGMCEMYRSSILFSGDDNVDEPPTGEVSIYGGSYIPEIPIC